MEENKERAILHLQLTKKQLNDLRNLIYLAEDRIDSIEQSNDEELRIAIKDFKNIFMMKD